MRKRLITVEEIHEEFDSAQERLLLQSKNIIENNTLPQHKAKKAGMLEKLGFKSVGIVKENIAANEKIQLSEKMARDINELKFEYPLEKFITVEELDRICNKYGLIHAPVGNYTEDIPEKNVLEMENCKKLSSEHQAPDREIFHYTGGFRGRATIKQRIAMRKGIDITDMDRSSIWGVSNNDVAQHAFGEGICKYNNIDRSITTIQRSGLFIAAPKTHFNLKGLKKATKFGFFTSTKVEMKDPVVFQYCKNDVIRIITKWGTDDDQSYLDPSLTNNILN